jgi:phage/plasmid-like protein (TIGR03299 family)
MAHEIDLTTGRAAMAYAGETPWHGLGERIDARASIEEWQRAAGMDWTIKDAPILFAPEGGDGPVEAELTRKVLYRSDTKAALSVVGDRYNVVQPSEVLEFFRDLTEAGGFEMSTAGVLHAGKKLWALAKIGEDGLIGKKDRVRGNVLLVTSCDGSMATTAKLVSERVVCANTLRMAMGEDGDEVRIVHSTKFDAAAVKEQLGVAANAWDTFMQQARELAKVKLTDSKALAVLREGFADGIDADYETMEFDKFGALPTVEKVMALYKGGGRGSDLASANGTAWGLVNAVTEFYDHHVKAKLVDTRLESAWFGKGAFVKGCVFDQALTLI